MTGKTNAPGGPVFADITTEVDAVPAEPDTAAFIEAQRPAREAMNRAFAMNLATIRKAAELTPEGHRRGDEPRPEQRVQDGGPLGLAPPSTCWPPESTPPRSP